MTWHIYDDDADIYKFITYTNRYISKSKLNYKILDNLAKMYIKILKTVMAWGKRWLLKKRQIYSLNWTASLKVQL